jgi:lipid-A-disaccharide synthase
MEAQGLLALFPMSDLAVMGFAEVVPHLPRLIRRLRETVSDIARIAPDVVVSIDSPGFTLRVAERVRRLGIPVVHYVAPQLWAWHPERGRKLARQVDRILALLPFEPEFFARFGVSCTFVGHPIVERGLDRGDGAAFRRRHRVADDATVVAVLPGSRQGEVDRLLPVFGAALSLLARRFPGLVAVVPTVPAVAETVSSAVSGWAVPTVVVPDPAEKADALAVCTAAMVKSGTSTLELALAGVPMVVAYRVGRITAILARHLITVERVAIVNLLAGRELVPELLQDDCRPDRLAAELGELLADAGRRERMKAEFASIAAALGASGQPPGERAADAILRFMAESRSAP